MPAGGWAFFRKDSSSEPELLTTSALIDTYTGVDDQRRSVDESVLHFEGPFTPAAAASKTLLESNLLMEVPLDSFRRLGMKRFAWIGPNELVGETSLTGERVSLVDRGRLTEGQRATISDVGARAWPLHRQRTGMLQRTAHSDQARLSQANAADGEDEIVEKATTTERWRKALVKTQLSIGAAISNGLGPPGSATAGGIRPDAMPACIVFQVPVPLPPVRLPGKLSLVSHGLACTRVIRRLDSSALIPPPPPRALQDGSGNLKYYKQATRHSDDQPQLRHLWGVARLPGRAGSHVGSAVEATCHAISTTITSALSSFRRGGSRRRQRAARSMLEADVLLPYRVLLAEVQRSGDPQVRISADAFVTGSLIAAGCIDARIVELARQRFDRIVRQQGQAGNSTSASIDSGTSITARHIFTMLREAELIHGRDDAQSAHLPNPGKVRRNGMPVARAGSVSVGGPEELGLPRQLPKLSESGQVRERARIHLHVAQLLAHARRHWHVRMHGCGHVRVHGCGHGCGQGRPASAHPASRARAGARRHPCTRRWLW